MSRLEAGPSKMPDAEATRRQTALEVIAEVSGAEVGELRPETELVADLGVDSAKALTMLVELEDRLEITIEDDEVTELATVGDVLRAIDEVQ